MHFALNRAEKKIAAIFFFLNLVTVFPQQMEAHALTEGRRISRAIWLTLLLTSVTLKGLNIYLNVSHPIVLSHTF